MMHHIHLVWYYTSYTYVTHVRSWRTRSSDSVLGLCADSPLRRCHLGLGKNVCVRRGMGVYRRRMGGVDVNVWGVAGL